MKTKLNTFFAVAIVLFFSNCHHTIVQSFCDQYTNADSLREELIIHFDVNSYYAMACCCPDSCMATYAILLTDSAPGFILSCDLTDETDVDDMVKMYYLSREYAKNDYWVCTDLLNFMLFDDDSIFSLLSMESYPAMLTITANEGCNQSTLIDSLSSQVMLRGDDWAYAQLRTLLGARQLFPIAKNQAETTNSPIACFDAYLCYISGYADIDDINQQYMLNMMLSASNQHYAPATFLLANMYLLGESMPRDTTRGKQLFSELGITPREPFWRYSPDPPVYQHLLDERARIIDERLSQ